MHTTHSIFHLPLSPAAATAKLYNNTYLVLIHQWIIKMNGCTCVWIQISTLASLLWLVCRRQKNIWKDIFYFIIRFYLSVPSLYKNCQRQGRSSKFKAGVGRKSPITSFFLIKYTKNYTFWSFFVLFFKTILSWAHFSAIYCSVWRYAPPKQIQNLENLPKKNPFSQRVLTWWCAGQHTGADSETGRTCWRVQPDSWCGDTYPARDGNTRMQQVHIPEIIPAPPLATVHGLPSSESCWTGWCGSPPGWADCRGRSPSVTSRSTMWCSSVPARVRGTQDTSEWRGARATRLRVSKAPQIVSTHHLVDGAIEGVILCENEQNNERHVDVMGISVLHVVKDLEDGQDLRGK